MKNNRSNIVLLLAIFLISTFEAFSEQHHEFKKEKIVISLGLNCAPAIHLGRNKLTEGYFPFDWCRSDFSSIYTALQNDFKDFLLFENLEPLSGFNHMHREVFDKKYTIIFKHDFDVKSFLRDYHDVKAKYDRRIERFYQALNSGKEIYFFRTCITKEEALKLRDLISYKFPLLHYTLVVVNDKLEYKTPWNEPCVRNLFLGDPTNASDGNNSMRDRWDSVLKNLMLI